MGPNTAPNMAMKQTRRTDTQTMPHKKQNTNPLACGEQYRLPTSSDAAEELPLLKGSSSVVNKLSSSSCSGSSEENRSISTSVIATFQPKTAFNKIGRASCRERV